MPVPGVAPRVCGDGHPQTRENVYRINSRQGVRFVCKPCHLRRQHDYLARRRARNAAAQGADR